MRLPDDAALDTAIMWLRDNEGDGGEAERCKMVADYLDHLQHEANLRKLARDLGVPVARVRRKIAQKAAERTAAKL